jgi:hypothetical protein
MAKGRKRLSKITIPIFYSLNKTHYLWIEESSREGRCNFCLFSNNVSQEKSVSFIIELKYTEDISKMKDKVKSGLDQILAKRYYEIIEKLSSVKGNLDNCALISICFCNKSVAVEAIMKDNYNPGIEFERVIKYNIRSKRSKITIRNLQPNIKVETYSHSYIRKKTPRDEENWINEDNKKLKIIDN